MKARILLIDDDQASQSFMKYLLNSFGHEVTVVADGAKGLREAVSRRPHLIISDAQLPAMDGCELARHLKADAATRDIPLVAVTASAMPADRQRMLSAGFNGYIAKPIVPETFVQEIERFLAKPDQTPASNPEPVSTSRRMQFIQEIAAGFSRNLPDMLGFMREALGQGDFKTMRKAAHKTLGSCIFLPEPDLIESLRRLEHAIDNCELESIQTLLGDVERNAATLIQRLAA